MDCLSLATHGILTMVSMTPRVRPIITFDLFVEVEATVGIFTSEDEKVDIPDGYTED